MLLPVPEQLRGRFGCRHGAGSRTPSRDFHRKVLDAPRCVAYGRRNASLEDVLLLYGAAYRFPRWRCSARDDL